MNESDMLQWLEELVEIPPEEDAALNELPDSFIWCRPLTRMTALTDPSSLGLPAFRGAVFAGPAASTPWPVRCWPRCGAAGTLNATR